MPAVDTAFEDVEGGKAHVHHEKAGDVSALTALADESEIQSAIPGSCGFADTAEGKGEGTFNVA